MGIITKGMGVIMKNRKAAKIKKLRQKAAAVGAAGAGVVGLGILKAKSILDQDYGSKKK
jgi:hypothetical protein